MQDDVEDDAVARFVGVLVSLRRKYQDLLQPLTLTSEDREFRWHGAYDGARRQASLPQILLANFAASATILFTRHAVWRRPRDIEFVA